MGESEWEEKPGREKLHPGRWVRPHQGREPQQFSRASQPPRNWGQRRAGFSSAPAVESFRDTDGSQGSKRGNGFSFSSTSLAHSGPSKTLLPTRDPNFRFLTFA